ncbi:hypothetical protein MKZ38_007717 [Zalerion maritima]|uniref:Methyltransferase domain-containing protein n=1 Tax=Zalerion maritima TaxID=339359 RepID=A0AAD5WPN8_9PEZI|nr:hypothetical protein MKZ38_007717 [Zalerion maritima]
MAAPSDAPELPPAPSPQEQNQKQPSQSQADGPKPDNEAQQHSTSSRSPTPEPVINPNPQLQRYYGSLESRIGYKVIFSGARHHAYWDKDTYFPFPLAAHLRRMEDVLMRSLDLPLGEGCKVVDFGCGEGRVASYLASEGGMKVLGIDVTEHHLEGARRRVAAESKKWDGAGKGAGVEVRKIDYHNVFPSLSSRAGTFDGAYAMETLSHATDVRKVVGNMRDLLRPGGRVVIHEFAMCGVDERAVQERQDGARLTDRQKAAMKETWSWINRKVAMPSNQESYLHTYKRVLEEEGLEDVELRDLSENVKPIIRLLAVLAAVPYVLFVKVLGMKNRFPNTVGGWNVWKYWGWWKYVVITARKPGGAAVGPGRGESVAGEEEGGEGDGMGVGANLG